MVSGARASATSASRNLVDHKRRIGEIRAPAAGDDGAHRLAHPGRHYEGRRRTRACTK
jgi:hypothetical protein